MTTLWILNITPNFGFPNKKEVVTHRFNTVFDITYTSFWDEGARLVIFDVDDTLTDHLGLVEGDMYKLLDRLHDKGFKLGIYSNCSPKRYEQLLEIFKDYEVFIVNEAKKPNPANYLQVIDHYALSPEQTIMVGDKVGTDLSGAALANIKYRVLVKPYSTIIGGKQTSFFQRALRRLEILFS